MTESIEKVTDRTNFCEQIVSQLKHKVEELKAKEDRNDEFMRDLLKRAEALEFEKVRVDDYSSASQKIWAKFNEIDTVYRENHTHYIQIENYLDKYLPLKVQKATGKTLLELFGDRPGFEERYGRLEERFLKEANHRILLDEGQPEVMRLMEREFVQFMMGALTLKDQKKVSNKHRSTVAVDTKTLGPLVSNVLNDSNDDGGIPIVLKETPGEFDYTSLSDYLRNDKTARLLPDLDYRKVVLDRKKQFESFCKLYSALTSDDDLHKLKE